MAPLERVKILFQVISLYRIQQLNSALSTTLDDSETDKKPYLTKQKIVPSLPEIMTNELAVYSRRSFNAFDASIRYLEGTTSRKWSGAWGK